MKERIALCLLPTSAVQAQLDEFISRYAARHGRAVFTSHLSLIAGADPAVLTEDKVAAMAARFAPVALPRDGLMRTTRFTRAFALQYRITAAVQAMREAAVELAVNISPVAFIPHISLTYGEPPEVESLNAIAVRFEEPLLFDALQTNIHREPDTTQDDIAAFRPGPRHPLTGVC